MAERCSALRIGEPHLQRWHTNTKIEGDSCSGRSLWPSLHLPPFTETRTYAMGSITATTTITTTTSVPDLKNVTLLEQSPYLVGLMTILRNAETDSSEFGSCVDRVARLVLASGKSLHGVLRMQNTSSSSTKIAKESNHSSIEPCPHR